MITNSASGTRIDEVAQGIYRISTPVSVVPGGFTFNQYLIAGEEPLLFHTGPRRMFPLVREAIEAVLPPASLRHIGLSHFEADECGALNEFLAIAPDAAPLCGRIAAMVSVHDVADRKPRALADGESLGLGSHDVRWLDTPHVRHGWECGYLFEERTRTLLCGELLDFAPTFLDLAGVPKPRQLEGRSALPLWTGRVAAADWKPEDFIYEYYWEWNFPMTPTTFAIERDRMKYIQYHGIFDIEELYDLARDPDEMRNLIDDPSQLQTKIALRKALFEKLADAGGRHAVPYTGRFSRGVVRRGRSGSGAAPFPDAWLVEPNRPDRFDDLLPDSEAKAQAEREGRPFLPLPPSARRQQWLALHAAFEADGAWCPWRGRPRPCGRTPHHSGLDFGPCRRKSSHR